jgi:ABC-type lipoprotein export system ATPase subunit
LKGVNLVINRGDIAVITGQSGSGKSTLLNILGLLDSHDDGNYYLDGKLIKLKDNKEFASLRNRKIGFVFQAYHLISNLTVKENLIIPLLYRSEKIINQTKFDNDVNNLLAKFELLNLLNQKVGGLSGGEKQRISLCRALIADPEIILADEPTGNLDEINKSKIMMLFQSISKQLKKTIIIVTHDIQFKEIANKTYQISGGNLIEEIL